MRRREAICPIPELNEQVEDSSRERPSQSQEAAQLRRSEIGHEEKSEPVGNGGSRGSSTHPPRAS